jgi:2-polyprenyl-3-methyl-5-hydroxy-6-metoxy-1,4-benzoquinol methylase
LTCMISPITRTNRVKFLRKIKVSYITNLYKQSIQLDVSPYFSGLDVVEVYECLDSGYGFYYPFNLSGDSSFYGYLQNFDWYYLDEKWEHRQMFDLNLKGKRILEVGCGSGSFVQVLKDKMNADVTGLELNLASVKRAREKNINVLDESVETHALLHEEKYDCVCSFQVLEHIADPLSNIKAQIRCLKKNGLLVVSVPNNEAFIKHDTDNLLNMPPHHMGLWTEESLKFLGDSLNLKIVKILKEPLQKYHVNWYFNLWLKRHVTGNLLRRMIFFTRMHILLKGMLGLFRKAVAGHSIIIVYQK